MTDATRAKPAQESAFRELDLTFHPLRDGMRAAIVVVAVASLSIAVLYFAARRAYVTEVREDLLRLAQVAAAFVDGDLHRSIVSPDQQDSPAYDRAVAPLRKILQGDPSIRFLYTVVLVDGEPRFILDATPSGDADGDGIEDHSPVMERYESPDAEMLLALRESRPIVMEDSKADRWGSVLSAYAPFYDSRGNPVGVVGLDTTADNYAARLRVMGTAALAAFLPATLFSVLAGVQVHQNQLRKLKNARERQSAQAALEEALARFENLVEYAPAVAIQGVDRQGVVSHWNLASVSLYGYDKSDAIGRRLSKLVVAPEEAVAFEQTLEELWRTGQPTPPREWRVRRSDGQQRWVYSSMFPVFSHGVLAEAFCMDVDISERKRHEEEMAAYASALESANEALKKYSEAAEQATRAKSAFLANMSHEIRTPMTAILGFTQMLRSEAERDASASNRRELLRTVERNAQHLLTILNDILDLSKIEAGKLQVERMPCSPVEILADVIALLQGRASAKRLALSLEYAGPIPETISTDPTRLRQILVNLVGNAIKFTEKGGVRVVASLLDGDKRAPRLACEVTDSGIGLTAEQIERLFQPFHQADVSTNRKFGGTGLGLAISRRLAEMLDGQISVDSVPGRGSRFTVTVATGSLAGIRRIERPEAPAHRGNAEFERRGLLPHPQTMPIPGRVGCDASVNGFPAQTQTRSGTRVLLAEDTPDLQRLAELLLQAAGADVTTVDNGEKAVEKTLDAEREGHPFDLVLMDMQMPVMDGYEATRRLRLHGYRGRIVALTAHAMAGDRQQCLECGCDEYLAKPLDPERLTALVQKSIVQKSADAIGGREGPRTSPADEEEGEEEEALYSQYADRPVIAQILGDFVRHLEERIPAMRAALADSHVEELQRLAHQLKGAGGSYGYPSLSIAAQELEEECRQGRWESAASVLERIAALARAVRRGWNPSPPPVPQVS